MNILLEKYGLSFEDDFLILDQKDPRTRIFGQNTVLVDHFNSLHPVSQIFSDSNTIQLNIPDSRSIKLKKKNNYNMKIIEIASSTLETLRVKDIYHTSDLKQVNKSQYSKGRQTFAAASIGNISPNDKSQETRIITVGSGQFLSNGLLKKNAHQNFIHNIINYLLKEDEFISLKINKEIRRPLLISTAKSVWILLFICFFYPFLFLGGGTVVWYRRKKS